jgi:type II secretory pathway component PulC
MKYILRNITVLNLLLMAALAAFASYALFPLMTLNVTYKPPVVKKKAQPAAAQGTGEQPSVSISDYMTMAEENLFHPERIIPVEKRAELPKPEFVLFGTLITDDVSVAYMEDKKAPVTSPGRGKRQVPLKKGQALSGFTVKEIEKTRVVMVRGEETLVVNLDVQKTREAGGPGSAQSPATASSAPKPAVPPSPVFPSAAGKFAPR